MAFGLPILANLADSYEIITEEGETKPKLSDYPRALILTPTRELAVQIKDHLQICCKHQKTKVIFISTFSMANKLIKSFFIM